MNEITQNYNYSEVTDCYIVICWFMQKYTYICWIHTDAMNNRRIKISLQKYLPLTLLQGFEKGYSRFACERELETEQKLQYFDPKLMAVNVVSLSFSWCSTGGPGSTLLGDGFFYCILSATSLVPKLHRGSRGPPRPGVTFPTTSRLPPTGTRTQLALDFCHDWAT